MAGAGDDGASVKTDEEILMDELRKQGFLFTGRDKATRDGRIIEAALAAMARVRDDERHPPVESIAKVADWRLMPGYICPHGVAGLSNCYVCTPRDPEPLMDWKNPIKSY